MNLPRTILLPVLFLAFHLQAQLLAPDVYLAKLSYQKAMAELKAAKDDYNRWIALTHAAKESLVQKHDAEAKSFAEELEKLAPKNKDDWNYGNAVQVYNLVLGSLALKSNDVKAAGERLLAAGRSPGSPQMNTFGPNMTLAKELLEKGEKKVVLEYFELCKKFWEMHDGKLDQWKKEVERGKMPDFGANLDY